MPRYFKPWEEGLPKLRAQLSAVGDLKYLSKAKKLALASRMAAAGLAPNQHNTLVLLGGGGVRRVLVVFDTSTLQIRAILRAD